MIKEKCHCINTIVETISWFHLERIVPETHLCGRYFVANRQGDKITCIQEGVSKLPSSALPIDSLLCLWLPAVSWKINSPYYVDRPWAAQTYPGPCDWIPASYAWVCKEMGAMEFLGAFSQNQRQHSGEMAPSLTLLSIGWLKSVLFFHSDFLNLFTWSLQAKVFWPLPCLWTVLSPAVHQAAVSWEALCLWILSSAFDSQHSVRKLIPLIMASSSLPPLLLRIP